MAFPEDHLSGGFRFHGLGLLTLVEPGATW